MGDPVSQALLGDAGVKKLVSSLTPDLPAARIAPIPGARKRATQRAAQRKYAGAGRAGTLLTEGDKLG